MGLIKKIFCVVLIIVFVVFGTASFGYFLQQEKEPEKTETVEEPTPLRIDIPEKTKDCSFTVYDANGEVLFSGVGEATVEKKQDDGSYDISIQTPYTGNE